MKGFNNKTNIFLSLILLGAFAGCGAQKVAEQTIDDQKSESGYTPTVAATYTGKDGTFKEGESFSFQSVHRFPSDFSSGYTFTLKPIPGVDLSWVNLNATTGVVSGNASKIGLYELIIIAHETGTSKTVESTPISIGINGDPLRTHAWHLKNTGQATFANSGGVAGIDINVNDVFKDGITGAGVRIAVSDNGVEIKHDDLHTNALVGEHRNYALSPPFLGDPIASNAHGTAVTGIITALGWNNLGSIGVAPKAKFAGFQFLNSPQTTERLMHQASGNFDIFNFSYGDTIYADNLSNPDYIDRLRYETLTNKKVYTKAAGNEFMTGQNNCLSHNANFPFENESPFVIVVGAVDASGKKAFYSNAGSNIWVSAPGGDRGSQSSGGKPAILTTDLPTCLKGYAKAQNGLLNGFEYNHAENKKCNYTSTMNGTSSAAPIVAGVVALIKEANPNLTYRDIKHILAKTAQRVDPTHDNEWGKSHPSMAKAGCGSSLNLSGYDHELGWVQNAANYYYNNFYGFGMVDAKAAVDMAKTYTPNTFGSLIELNKDFNIAKFSKTVSLAIPDKSKDGVTDTLSLTEDIVVETVQVKVQVTHATSGDIGLELTSPSGTKSIILNVNSSLHAKSDSNLNVVLASQAFYGEDSAGTWTLKVIDGFAADTGTLTGWQINVMGHAK